MNIRKKLKELLFELQSKESPIKESPIKDRTIQLLVADMEKEEAREPFPNITVKELKALRKINQ